MSLRAAKPKPAPDRASAEYLLEALSVVGPAPAANSWGTSEAPRAVFAAESAPLTRLQRHRSEDGRRDCGCA